MERPPHEPRKRSNLSLMRTQMRIVGCERFAALVKAIEQATSDHLAMPSDIRQAASYVARAREWQLYAIRQGHCAQVRHLEDDEEEGDNNELV